MSISDALLVILMEAPIALGIILAFVIIGIYLVIHRICTGTWG